jgi:hypothetical protein
MISGTWWTELSYGGEREKRMMILYGGAADKIVLWTRTSKQRRPDL